MTMKCNVLLWIECFTRGKKAIKGIIKSIVKMDAHPQGPNRGLPTLPQDPSQVW